MFRSIGASCGLVAVLGFSLACSSSDSTPTSGDASTKTKARLLVASETTAGVQVIDLEQSSMESQAKSYVAGPTLVASPEGNFGFVVQTSGNRVNILKKGTSTAASTSTTTATTDAHGHQHKARFAAGHDHGTTTTTSEASAASSSTTTSSVEEVSYSITGQNLGMVVSKGQWVSFQFQDKVVTMAEESLENNLNSVTEPLSSVTYSLNGQFPGVPLDSAHMALGGNVYHISTHELEHSSSTISANGLVSANVLSATRSAEGLALFGTDQGLLLVCKHTETGNVQWEDFFISYPTVAESQIYLAGGHDHDHDATAVTTGVDEHAEVEAHRAATQWATHDALGHAFVHLTHETHSAGVYLLEAQTVESNSPANAWEYIAGTSSANVRPVNMGIAKMELTVSGNHVDAYRLLILMSDGSLRVHDAANEGVLLTVIPNVIQAVTDFHPGEGNFPGLSFGLGKAYVGDPKALQIHQIDLSTNQIELTWTTSSKPNQLLVLGESSLAESAAHQHKPDAQHID